MNSKIFTGKVSHYRSWPIEHRFCYPVYFFRFDLDELPVLNRELFGFGYNRLSLFRLDDKDYFWRGKQPLKEKISDVLQHFGHDDSIARIELVSFASFLNLTFRPVSFFLCYDSDNNCRMILTEVHNTFKETHLYILKHDDDTKDSLCFEIPKAFHVSPFFDLDGKYIINLKKNDDEFDISIKLIKPNISDKPVFSAMLNGKAKPLTSKNLCRTLLKYPFGALLNMPRIIWQASKLYFRKKLPVYRKPVPQSEYTMRKQTPSWLARQGMKTLFDFFQLQQVGKITVSLPEGKHHSFGPDNASLSTNLLVTDHRFFKLIASTGEIGLGISYEKGYWKSDNLTDFMKFMLTATQLTPIKKTLFSRLLKSVYLTWNFKNRNTIPQARKNISCHYDLSNQMYQLFLDETMTYSCAVFENGCEDLKSAQIRKIDKILDKARINESHHILEIGTGWGALAIRAAQRFGCRVTSITLSSQQKQFAQQRIDKAGLADKVNVQLCDYRNVEGLFDRIVSVEMLEAVGKSYFPVFFRSCDKLLKPDGLLVIQTITIPDQRYHSYAKTTDWMRLFIFPGGLLPSLTALANVLSKNTSFVIKDIESIGLHYALTLAHWKKCFLDNREKILQLGFPKSFINRWEYYFSYCEAGFAQSYIDNLQLVISRSGSKTITNEFEINMKK